MSILQLALNTLALAGIYALVALGFALVINAVGAVNFAHGDLVMAGGFVAVLLAGLLDWPGIALMPLVVLATGALGLALSLLAYFPLRHGPPAGIYVSTIAVGLLLQNAVLNLFGAAPRRGPVLIDAAASGVPVQALASIAVAIAAIGGVYLLLRRSQLGRQLRATAQNPAMAEAIGIDTRRMIAFAFALAAGLAGLAGLLLAPIQLVTPYDGPTLIVKAYIAVVIGGWGRIGGTVLGALAIAVFEVTVATVLSQPAAEATLYIVLLGVLWLRPHGVFGEMSGERA
jgi:branched-chain amino acid transport system permease protein